MGHVICVWNDKYIITYYSRNLQENITMEDLHADGRIMLLIYVPETGNKNVDWIHVA